MIRRFSLVGAVLVAFTGPAALAQPATQRTPNLEGTWITPGGTVFFAFLHRFQLAAGSVINYPTFHLSTGVTDWASAGLLYSTKSYVPGQANELEAFAAERLLDETRGWPLSLALKEAYNVTASSPDGELALSRAFGPLTTFGTLRGMGNFKATGALRLNAGLGASFALTPALALAADVGMSPTREATEAPVVWGLGAQIQIPSSPHTLSLQVSNAASSTLQGASIGTDTLRYGFDFTVPFNSVEPWLRIFQPARTTTEVAPDQAGAKAFFATRCATCHGAAGTGAFGPDLRPVEAKGDAFIANRIRLGSPKGMPPFAGDLAPEELKALVEYVKGL